MLEPAVADRHMADLVGQDDIQYCRALGIADVVQFVADHGRGIQPARLQRARHQRQPRQQVATGALSHVPQAVVRGEIAIDMAQAGQALVQQLEVIGLFASHAQPVQVKRRRHAGETPDDVQRQVDRVEFDMRQRVQQRARPSGEAGERCRSCCGDTSRRAGRPGSARVGSRRRSVSTMGASSMARTAASLPAQSSTPARAGPEPADRRRPAGGYCCSYAGFQWRAPATRASATVSAAGLSGAAARPWAATWETLSLPHGFLAAPDHRNRPVPHRRPSMGRAGRRPTLPAPRLLRAMHETGCASPRTGWSPHYLAVARQTRWPAPCRCT